MHYINVHYITLLEAINGNLKALHLSRAVRERTERAENATSVGRSIRDSDWLVANGGTNDVASLQIARFGDFGVGQFMI